MKTGWEIWGGLLGGKEGPEVLHSTCQYLKEATQKLETDLHFLVPKQQLQLWWRGTFDKSM